MPPNIPPPLHTTPKSSSRGCFFWGCITTIILAIVAILAIWLIFYGVRKQVETFVADKPSEIKVYQPTEEEIRIAKDKISELEEAVKTGQARTLSITADDLNTLIATQEDLKELKGKVFLRIEGDILSAKGSIPLSMLADIPLLNMLTDWTGKYLNGDMDLRVTNSNDRLQVYFQDIRVKDKPLDDEFMKEIRRTNLIDEMRKQQDPKTQEGLRKFEQTVESVEVKDGKIIVRTKDNPNAEQAPSSVEETPAAPAPATP